MSTGRPGRAAITAPDREEVRARVTRQHEERRSAGVSRRPDVQALDAHHRPQLRGDRRLVAHLHRHELLERARVANPRRQLGVRRGAEDRGFVEVCAEEDDDAAEDPRCVARSRRRSRSVRSARARVRSMYGRWPAQRRSRGCRCRSRLPPPSCRGSARRSPGDRTSPARWRGSSCTSSIRNRDQRPYRRTRTGCRSAIRTTSVVKRSARRPLSRKPN